jgi:hypothetical protein
MKPSTRVREGAVVEQRRAVRAGRPDHQPAGRAARCCSQRPRIGAESRVETADGEQPWCGHPPQRGDRIKRHLLGGRREVDDGRNRPVERRRGDEGGGPTPSGRPSGRAASTLAHGARRQQRRRPCRCEGCAGSRRIATRRSRGGRRRARGNHEPRGRRAKGSQLQSLRPARARARYQRCRLRARRPRARRRRRS